MLREIILDTETTGLDPHSGHRIVEIGCVEMIDGVRSGQFYHTYLNPERDMPPEAFRVHGLSREFLQDKPCFRSICDEFMAFIADAQLVIHNAEFDLKFINHEIARHGHPAIPVASAVDTVKMARKKFPGAPANLDALCRRFEINLGSRTKHGALLDAELLAEVYIELLGGKQVSLALEPANQAIIQTHNKTPRVYLPPREFLADAAELAQHQTMMATLKDPLWLKLT